MTAGTLFGRACGTSPSAPATSTPHAGVVTAQKQRAYYAHDSSQVTPHGCRCTRDASTTWLSSTQLCRVYSQARRCWFRCQAVHPQRAGHGPLNAWRSRCMELA